MIPERKWDDHAVLSCAAYKQCRRRMIFIHRRKLASEKAASCQPRAFFGTGLIIPMG